MWRSTSEALLRKLFESLKSVTTLTCTRRYPSVEPKDTIDAMTCNLRNLESFTIETNEPLKAEDVNALVNLPRLKYVTIRQDPSRKPIAEACAVEVVKKLAHCAHLVQLEISGLYLDNWSQIIAEAAVMYDWKDFDLFIDQEQYRIW